MDTGKFFSEWQRQCVWLCLVPAVFTVCHMPRHHTTTFQLHLSPCIPFCVASRCMLCFPLLSLSFYFCFGPLSLNSFINLRFGLLSFLCFCSSCLFHSPQFTLQNLFHNLYFLWRVCTSMCLMCITVCLYICACVFIHKQERSKARTNTTLNYNNLYPKSLSFTHVKKIVMVFAPPELSTQTQSLHGQNAHCHASSMKLINNASILVCVRPCQPNVFFQNRTLLTNIFKREKGK